MTGVVQGVGFRPFVARLANDLGLVGRVWNDSTMVIIEVVGSTDSVCRLAERIIDEPPPLARVVSLTRTPVTNPIDTSGFHIVESRRAEGASTLVPPDAATCDTCVDEMFDPSDRRYRHPFITCTDCGPRFTIIGSLPYDRPNTTMEHFEMCPSCRREYEDPLDRRFHAQPVSCHECGPVLWWADSAGADAERDEALGLGVDVLRHGGVIALKGVGGYHLVCDARSDLAIASLRGRKHRPDKALAVMVASLGEARARAHLDDVEAEELSGCARPIVLVGRRESSDLSPSIAPANPLVGLLLPYTGVHHLLFAAGAPPLVMTSANLSGQPILHSDDLDPLLMLADGVLGHDRPIHTPADDSVVRVVAGAAMPIRRGRGHAPMPVPVPSKMCGRVDDVVAAGADQKNTFSVGSGDWFWTSQHVGELNSPDALDVLSAGVRQFAEMYRLSPGVVAVDAHPGYHGSRWGRSYGDTAGVRVETVQHHHAHVCAMAAEAGLEPDEPIIGVAFDGTGYGSDRAIWGGEFMIADAFGFERMAHLGYVPLPGGDASVRVPARSAVAHLLSAGVELLDDLAPVRYFDKGELTFLKRQVESGIGTVPTSSMGRLFDAVASLLNLCHEITYEAQGPVLLEFSALGGGEHPYRFETVDGVIDAGPVVRSVVSDLAAGRTPAEISWRFHETVASMVVDAVQQIHKVRAITRVALVGGVFQNALLTQSCSAKLEDAGFEPMIHRLVPSNDGGLSLGQAWIAAARSMRRS
ncbi:MAG: carbamoyltransferase HypF [Actinomycetia bacterium]|nr:carbamoyltransferase HypF [Actinomycetes bacterium]